MANTVTVTFCAAHGLSQNESSMPTIDLSDPLKVTNVISSDGTNKQTVATSPHPQGKGFVSIYNNGTAVIAVAAGTNPTASSTDLKIGPNSNREFAIDKGHKVAVIEVA